MGGVRLVAPEAPLETPRLVLEPLTAAHAAALLAALGDERLYRFIPDDPPSALEELEARYRWLANRRSPDGSEAWLNWAMRLRGTEAYVGTLQASVYPDRTADVAYMVFVPHQRQGYAKEGLARVLAHLFDDYDVDTVAAEIDTRNAASIALVEGLGFARVATLQAADFFKGASSDEYRYELRSNGLRPNRSA
jgi:RimJ/RimL family protein N-acetyltransferase